jgi:hypothetical protein
LQECKTLQRCNPPVSALGDMDVGSHAPHQGAAVVRLVLESVGVGLRGATLATFRNNCRAAVAQQKICSVV